MNVTPEQIAKAYQIARRCDAAAKLVGLSTSQFKRRMHVYGIPFLPRSEQLGRCKQWKPVCSRELAYVLGVLLGDGHVAGRRPDKGNSFRIRLQVVDRVFAEKFCVALRAIGLGGYVRRATQDKRPNRKPAYVTKTSSRLFSDWYRTLSLDDIARLVAGYEEAFVCGLWESEGHIIPEGNSFDVSIGMTREDVIDLLFKILSEWGFFPTKQGPYKDNRGAKDIYRVILARKDDTPAFIRMIDPCIRRSPR